MLRVMILAFFFTSIAALIFITTFIRKDIGAYPDSFNTLPFQEEIASSRNAIPVCGPLFSHIAPCFKNDNYALYHEQRCLPEKLRLNCLVPLPRGYKVPIRWSRSRNQVWYLNVRDKLLAMEKLGDEWMEIVGDLVVFRSGGAGFPDGVEKYIALLAMMVNSSNGDLSKNGKIRTVLDIGCGVASFGEYLLTNDILTMSIAPHDIQKKQIQFALERGIPAALGILRGRKLPYPSKSFDMIHCSWCNIDWTDRNGILLLEVDRLLRPGGLFIWSSGDDKGNVSTLVNRMCWSFVAEEKQTTIWEKPLNNSCYHNQDAPRLCYSWNADDAWQTPLEDCMVPMQTGYEVKPWPERLNTVPARLREFDTAYFKDDTSSWRKRVGFCWKILESQLKENIVRNVLDMNAYLGGFAAALIKKPVWVMNVIPTTMSNKLGVVYDRGLIGSLHNWCEPFPSYPRTYDLIHAFYIISEASVRCDMVNILLEMDRLLRPMGFVIVNDHPKTVDNVTKYLSDLHWDAWTAEASFGEESILFARKQFWDPY